MSSAETKRRSPYQGLIPYTEADASFFFGREKETRLIIANLFGSPLTLLYGATGVGKSSVLHAGVAHQLRNRKDLLVVVFNSWQANPLSDLKTAIADAAGDVKAGAVTEPDSIALADFLVNYSAKANRRLMIILDQFEEYFLYHPQDDEFAAEFPRAVMQSEAPVTFLISIREDFYARLDRFEGRIPSLYDNYLRIEHLDRKAAQVAIEEPIAEYNRVYRTARKPFDVEPELVEAVLKQVEAGRVVIGEAGRGVIELTTSPEEEDAQIETPFLQLVMTRLWDEELLKDSRDLKLATLNRLGGAESIVRTHLDKVMDKLLPKEQDTAVIIFRYLVTPSGTKIAYTTSDLAAIAEADRAEVEKVMTKLSQGQVRVFRPVDSSTRPGETRYEIFHDVLAPAILDWRTRRLQLQLVSQTLEQSLGGLNELDLEIAARIFPLLLTPSRTRSVSTLERLASITGLPVADIRRVVAQLSAIRVLRLVLLQENAVEVSHDLLVEPILNWLRNYSHLRVSYLGFTGRILMAAYFTLMALLLVYGLVCFWPSALTGGESGFVEPVTFLSRRILVSDNVRLLIIAILAGTLGGLIKASTSFAWYIGNRLLTTKWITYFVLLPFVAAAWAGLFYFILQGGFLNAAATAGSFNPFSIAALAGLIGLFSSQSTNKLIDLFKTHLVSSSVKDIHRASKID